MRETAKGVKGVWDKYRYAALVIGIGVALMVWPTVRTAPEHPDTECPAEAVRDIQREMEEVLGKIAGVGEVRVLLTEESDGERKLAVDTSTSVRDGGNEYSRNSGTVLVDAGSGLDEVVVIRTYRPTYRGALIVCQGGGSAAVRLAVTRAVSALTGLPAGRIAVEQWQ